MTVATKPRPEKTFSYAGGLFITVWLNPINTPEGVKFVRSFVPSRRYKDAKTNEFKDSDSFSLPQLRVLRLAFSEVEQFCATTPVPSRFSPQSDDLPEAPSAPNGAEEDVPF